MTRWFQSVRLPLLFIETLIAVFLFALPLRRRSQAALRLAAILLVGCFVCYWDAKLLYTLDGGALYFLPRTVCMIILYFLVIGASFFFYDISGWTALYVASAGYTVMNIAGSIKSLAKIIPAVSAFSLTLLGEPALDILCFAPTYALLFLVFRSSIVHNEENYDNHLKAIFSFVVLMLCIVMFRVTQDNADRNAVSQILEYLYAVVTSVLILQAQFSILDKNQLERSVDAMRELIHQQHAQFEASKESTQLIHEKYHDLKQMISTLSGRISQRELDQFQQSISGYDAAVHTGNDVLDVILTEKKMLCEKQNIHITCLAGGVDLRFVNELDLYSLFSNALTNAIEAVNKIPETQPRYITLSLQKQGSLTILHVENPCAETVQFKDGRPQSRKDALYHGFGFRSMERTALKYGGTAVARQSGNMFFLDVTLMEF